jgi:hypothetical protein
LFALLAGCIATVVGGLLVLLDWDHKKVEKALMARSFDDKDEAVAACDDKKKDPQRRCKRPARTCTRKRGMSKSLLIPTVSP